MIGYLDFSQPGWLWREQTVTSLLFFCGNKYLIKMTSIWLVGTALWTRLREMEQSPAVRNVRVALRQRKRNQNEFVSGFPTSCPRNPRQKHMAMNRGRNPAAKFAVSGTAGWEFTQLLWKFKPDLAGKYKKSCASCAGRCDTRVPELAARCPEPEPGVAANVPGSGSEWRCHPGTAPGPMPPGAAQELLPEIQELLSSQIRLCLHCNQSLTYCKCSIIWLCVCWVFLSAAAWKENSSLPGYMGCWRFLPCQGVGGKQASLLSYMDFRDIKNPLLGIAQKAM